MNARNATATNDKIDARPTKEFFIYMLTKDIKLIRAIVDLVDNSWDGALRLRDKNQTDELCVRLEFDEDTFKITDNCGGIPYNVAKYYAFRFGRPKGMPKTDHSVGQFGVGMKRSLFKLGLHFRVESNTQDVDFVVEHDVDEWVDRDEWEFGFESVTWHGKKKRQLAECGTTVTVSRLHEGVRTDFRSEIFESQLKKAIESAHQRTIGEGFSITINKIPLQASVAKLSRSADLKPAHRTLTFAEESPSPITVKLYAGIAESDPQEAGWHIYCNGRMVVEADGTFTTGWGEGNGRIIPRFHNQFARFRGFAFFDCDDASKLPWNTTKSGVDSDSALYQAARQRMIEMMRPVIDFLNRVDAEKDVDANERHLTETLEKAKQSKLSAISESPHFVVPAPRARRITGPKVRRIQYDKPEDEIDQVKHSLGVNTLKEVGEGTFDYFFKLECE